MHGNAIFCLFCLFTILLYLINATNVNFFSEKYTERFNCRVFSQYFRHGRDQEVAPTEENRAGKVSCQQEDISLS